MTIWKWLLLAVAGTILFFYIRTGNTVADDLHVSSSDESLSVRSFLIARTIENGKATIAMTGSSVVKGSGATRPAYNWPSRLYRHLVDSDKRLKRLTFHNFGHPGYTSVQLLDPSVTTPIVKAKPDVLMIETAVINNHNKNVSMEDTLSSIQQLHDFYTEQLPDTRLVFLSPNPCTENKFGPHFNRFGLTFVDYVNETKAFITKSGWEYFDTHTAMDEKLQQLGYSRYDVLKDGIHPNNLGYAVWEQVLWPYVDGRK